jgi:mycothiol synthase
MNDNIIIQTYRPEDLPALVTLTNECDAYDKMERATSLAELEHEWSIPNYYPESDCFMAWKDGRLVGYADIFMRAGGAESICYSWGLVHPEWRRHGLGQRLMETIYRRAKERLAEIDGGEVYLQTSGRSEETDRRALFEAFGMQVVRYFVNLARPLNGDLPAVEVPVGYRLRPFERGRDAEAVWQVENLAFRDHWGASDIPLEEFIQHQLELPHFRPELSVVAEEEATGQIVGMSMNDIAPNWIKQSGRKEGFVHTLAVLREARGRGLGTALLVQSLHILHQEGMEGAHLNADAENLTGAMRLYERVGFRLRKTYIAYRKILRGNGDSQLYRQIRIL